MTKERAKSLANMMVWHLEEELTTSLDVADFQWLRNALATLLETLDEN